MALAPKPKPDQASPRRWTRAAIIAAGFAIGAVLTGLLGSNAIGSDPDVAQAIVAAAIGLALGVVVFRLSLR